MTDRFDVAIVGGGIAGILAALYLSQKGKAVALIESEKSIGGLLKSIENAEGESFDIGTHFIPQIGNEEIDNLLLGDAKSWNCFKTLKVATYLEGRTNNTSSYIKPDHLKADIYNKAIQELLNLPAKKEANNLKDFFMHRFGPTLTKELFSPIIQKLLRTDLEHVSVQAARIFQLQRLIVLTPDETRKLKADPWIDERLSFHDSKEGASPLVNYYPPRGGVGTWINGLVQKMKDQGVKIFTDSIVSKMHKDGKRILSMELKSGQSIAASDFVWTIPPKLAADLLGLQVKSKPPEFVRTSVYMLTMNQSPLTPSYYITNFDRNHQTYRVTLFDNFSDQIHAGRYRACVEGFCSKNETPLDTNGIVKELQEMGIFANDVQVLHSHVISLQNGFPVITNDFINTMQSFASALIDNTDNLILCGKASGKTFFTTDTLLETLQSVQKI